MDPVKPLESPSEDLATPSEESTFGDILSQFEQETSGEIDNQTVQGTIVAIDGAMAFVDVGRKTDGVIAVEKLQAAGVDPVEPGVKVNVNVTGRDEEGNYQLSTIKVERPKDYSALETAFAEKATIAGRVVEQVKGGLRVDVGMRAFLPASRSGVRSPAELGTLVGQEIEVRITKLDTAKEDCVVDRRVVLEEVSADQRRKAFSALHEGDVVHGTVRTLTDFGAFVDIGGVDGLLHVSDISWNRTGKPADLLKVGDAIDVKILKINPDTRKVSLGMKQLVPDPWSTVAERYHPGDRVRGVVSRLTDFGAFVELEPGLDGLIHVTEMSWSKKTPKPGDVVKVGEQVDVAILNVNPAEHRIALGLKQALGDPWDEAPTKFPVGHVVEGKVINIQKFGVFVDLGDNFEGMIHIADITREKRLEHPKEALTMGQEIKAAVTEVDKDRRRIRLSMKQLEPTSTDLFITEHQVGETISGRILEVSNNRARVELGEGVVALCRLPNQEADTERRPTAEAVDRVKADISSSVALLTAKFRQGNAPATAEKEAPRRDIVRPGQVRTFRITSLSVEQRRIEVEMV